MLFFGSAEERTVIKAAMCTKMILYFLNGARDERGNFSIALNIIYVVISKRIGFFFAKYPFHKTHKTVN